MTAAATKSRILEDAGYAYSFDRMIYINRRAKKVFSFEFVDDHSGDVLQRCMNEDTPEGEWRFYFNSPPSEGVKRELEVLLG
jgi:hypothetical protein